MSQSNIVNGPSKDDLFQALKEPKHPHPRKVSFMLEGQHGLGFRVAIDGIDAEDGSGQSWNIRARLWSSQERVKIHFRTDTRKGTWEKILVH